MKTIFFLILLVPLMAFADVAVDPVFNPPEWLASILLFIKGLPYAGPVLIQIFKWSGVLAVVMTTLSVAVITLLKIPEVAARWAGAASVADKIEAFGKKVIPWLKYLSMFNVQKEELKKGADSEVKPGALTK